MNLEELQARNQELEILNAIAIQLNQEVELTKALTMTLQYSVDLLGMRTGWIWLLHPSTNSVFLAASHNLPPVFKQHPERLSGWCYCIDKYLASNLESATNISEITCTRLKDLEEGTNGLRFHATVPLLAGEEKIGILNIVSETSVQLNDRQLQLLNTIGELLTVAIQRTRVFEKSKQIGVEEERQRLAQNFNNNIITDLKILLQKISSDTSQNNSEVKNLIEKNILIAEQTILNLSETKKTTAPSLDLQYPYTPLSPRELEVLELLKLGKTNKAIANQLFIAERTVKFHVSAILSKLQADNRTDAVQIAMKHRM